MRNLRVALRAAAPLLWAAFAQAGCMMSYSLTERVTNAAREYNDDVRWARFEQAISHVPKDARDRFLERRTALSEELEIADAEVIGIDVDRKNDRASVRVQYSWTLRSRQLVERTVTRQEWEMEGQKWVVRKEVRVAGRPLVIFDEHPRPAVATEPEAVPAREQPAPL